MGAFDGLVERCCCCFRRRSSDTTVTTTTTTVSTAPPLRNRPSQTIYSDLEKGQTKNVIGTSTKSSVSSGGASRYSGGDDGYSGWGYYGYDFGGGGDGGGGHGGGHGGGGMEEEGMEVVAAEEMVEEEGMEVVEAEEMVEEGVVEVVVVMEEVVDAKFQAYTLHLGMHGFSLFFFSSTAYKNIVLIMCCIKDSSEGSL